MDFKEPFYARVVRIHPISWHNFPCMRFDVTFVDYCTDRILPKEETTAYKLAKCKNEIEDWSEEEKKAHSVYSVLAGNSVTYLSEYNIDHDNYFLDY